MHVHISKPNTTSQHDQKNGGAADNTGGFQRQRRMKLETQDSQVGESTCLPRLSKSETGRDERAIRDPSVSRHGVLPAMQAALVGDVAFPPLCPMATFALGWRPSGQRRPSTQRERLSFRPNFGDFWEIIADRYLPAARTATGAGDWDVLVGYLGASPPLLAMPWLI